MAPNRVLGNVEYSFIAITLKSTLTQNGSMVPSMGQIYLKIIFIQ